MWSGGHQGNCNARTSSSKKASNAARVASSKRCCIASMLASNWASETAPGQRAERKVTELKHPTVTQFCAEMEYTAPLQHLEHIVGLAIALLAQVFVEAVKGHEQLLKEEVLHQNAAAPHLYHSVPMPVG